MQEQEGCDNEFDDENLPFWSRRRRSSLPQRRGTPGDKTGGEASSGCIPPLLWFFLSRALRMLTMRPLLAGLTKDPTFTPASRVEEKVAMGIQAVVSIGLGILANMSAAALDCIEEDFGYVVLIECSPGEAGSTYLGVCAFFLTVYAIVSLIELVEVMYPNGPTERLRRMMYLYSSVILYDRDLRPKRRVFLRRRGPTFYGVSLLDAMSMWMSVAYSWAAMPFITLTKKLTAFGVTTNALFPVLLSPIIIPLVVGIYSAIDRTVVGLYIKVVFLFYIFFYAYSGLLVGLVLTFCCACNLRRAAKLCTSTSDYLIDTCGAITAAIYGLAGTVFHILLIYLLTNLSIYTIKWSYIVTHMTDIGLSIPPPHAGGAHTGLWAAGGVRSLFQGGSVALAWMGIVFALRKYASIAVSLASKLFNTTPSNDSSKPEEEQSDKPSDVSPASDDTPSEATSQPRPKSDMTAIVPSWVISWASSASFTSAMDAVGADSNVAHGPHDRQWWHPAPLCRVKIRAGVPFEVREFQDVEEEKHAKEKDQEQDQEPTSSSAALPPTTESEVSQAELDQLEALERVPADWGEWKPRHGWVAFAPELRAVWIVVPQGGLHPDDMGTLSSVAGILGGLVDSNLAGIDLRVREDWEAEPFSFAPFLQEDPEHLAIEQLGTRAIPPVKLPDPAELKEKSMANASRAERLRGRKNKDLKKTPQSTEQGTSTTINPLESLFKKNKS